MKSLAKLAPYKVRVAGRSLNIRVPALAGLEIGDKVMIYTGPRRSIIIARPGVVRPGWVPAISAPRAVFNYAGPTVTIGPATGAKGGDKFLVYLEDGVLFYERCAERVKGD